MSAFEAMDTAILSVGGSPARTAVRPELPRPSPSAQAGCTPPAVVGQMALHGQLPGVPRMGTPGMGSGMPGPRGAASPRSLSDAFIETHMRML